MAPTARESAPTEDQGHAAHQNLTFLIFRDDHAPEWWVAQCLEYDLATQARTLEGLKEAIGHLLDGRTAVGRKFGLAPFEGLPPAPEFYRRAYEKGYPLSQYNAASEGRAVGEARIGDLVPA
jgi:hypothetical protein